MMVGENAPAKEAVEAKVPNVAARLKTIKEYLAGTASRLEGLVRFVSVDMTSPDEVSEEPDCLMDEVELIAHYTFKLADYTNMLSELLGA